MTDRAEGVEGVGSLWERHASWWQSEFTDGADPEYVEQILPLAQQLLSEHDYVLDLGAGEGQISRLLAPGAMSVVGVDPTWAQISEAKERAGGPVYAAGEADRLPFADNAFDAVVACLVFEHIDALDDAIAEVARVLQPDGTFALFLNHPLLQTPGSGWIEDHTIEPAEQYWRIGPYLVESSLVEEVRKDVFIPFVHRPLGRYVNSLAANGLLVREMHEPGPPPGLVARSHAYAAAAAIPRLLVLVCKLESAR